MPPCTFLSSSSGVTDSNFSTPSIETTAFESPPSVEPQRSAFTVTVLPSLVVIVKPTCVHAMRIHMGMGRMDVHMGMHGMHAPWW